MKLVVALDMATPDQNLDLVNRISATTAPADFALKVGLNTFIAGGFSFIEELKNRADFEIILDLKLYDIPTTMANAAYRIAETGLVNLMTIHASAGEQGMSEVMSAVKIYDNPPKVLGVTVLTSFTHDHCQKVYNRGRSEATEELVKEATCSGVDGVVCSAYDLGRIENWRSNNCKDKTLIKFVPGIELKPREDDQQRKGGLKEVVLGGADYIVVGRQIYNSEKPEAVVDMIVGKIDAMEKAFGVLERETKWTEEDDQEIEKWTSEV